MRRKTAALIAVCLAAVSCSKPDVAVTTTAIPSTTLVAVTQEPSTTTTTAPTTVVTGAPEPLANLIEAYYGYASGRVKAPPKGVPKQLLPAAGATPDILNLEVKAAVAGYEGTRLAVFATGSDVLGAINSGHGWQLVAGKAPSVGVKPWYGKGPTVVAVVGSDARPGEDVERTRADSIHIVAMDGRGHAGIVGIPRDSYVPIPGNGSNKINSALANGGPDLMMATFADLTGLELDGYVLTGFEGFGHLVDDVLGPFELDVPEAFSDKAAHADFEQGPQTIDGKQALAFSRTRKAFLEGDFRRSLNQGLVLLAGITATRLKSAISAPQTVADAAEWLYTDLGPDRLLALMLEVRGLSVTGIGNVVLKGSNATTSGGASIVKLDMTFASDTFADLADGKLDG